MGQLEDLKMFVSVVEKGSISRAAETMNIAKSAVSRRLNLLEERYGSRLIDREPGVWKITATGLDLYQRAVRVVSDAEDIESDFTQATQNLAGPLTISVPRDFGISYLNTELMAFKQRYPDIQLMVDFDDHLVDLSRDNYDFAIRITSKLTSDLIAKQIGTTRHRLCASPSYVTHNGQPDTLNDLGNHDLLHFGTARRAHWEFDEVGGKKQRIEFLPVLNSNSGVFLLEAALSGTGIAWLPDFICQPSIACGDLVTILPEMKFPEWGIYLVHAQARRLNRRMRLFTEQMQTACLPQDSL